MNKQRVEVHVGKAFLRDYTIVATRYDDEQWVKYSTEVAEFKERKDAEAFLRAVKNLLALAPGKFLNDFKPEEIAEFETPEDAKAFLKCVKDLVKLKKPKKVRANFYVESF